MKKILIIFAATLTFVACEKEIELKQEEVAPRIVVNSLFSAEDTVWLQLSESRNILYENVLPDITNATAKLWDSGENELGTFTHVENGFYYLAEPTPIAGNTYTLTVEAPGLNSVKASSETPSIINITSIDTTSDLPGDQLEFTVKIADDASQKNYYGVSIVYNGSYEDEFGDEVTFQYPYFTTREYYVNGNADVDGLKYGTEFYFSDQTFNGSTVTFKGTHYNGWMEGEGFYVVGLTSMSEDLYKYKVSYAKYQEAQGPFAEPVQVYSNIEDGFGIFGGSSIYRDTIWLE